MIFGNLLKKKQKEQTRFETIYNTCGNIYKVFTKLAHSKHLKVKGDNSYIRLTTAQGIEFLI